jgi:hypothetical protein
MAASAPPEQEAGDQQEGRQQAGDRAMSTASFHIGPHEIAVIHFIAVPPTAPMCSG